MNEEINKILDGKLMDGLKFCLKVYELYESIRSTPEGPSRFRMRQRPDKKLLEELIPICRYVQANYRRGRYLSVKWVDGSQQFDAELFQHGAYVDAYQLPTSAFLEVTSSMHPNEYLIRELLETKGQAPGVNGVRRRKNGEIEATYEAQPTRETIESDAKLIMNQVTKKAAIPYPENTILIVDCTLSMPYHPSEWEDLKGRVQATLPKTKFREIYFSETSWQYSFSVYP